MINRIITMMAAAISLGQSLAGTAINSTKATAQLNSSCNISATSINFGTSDPSANSQATGTFSVLCTKGTNYSIGTEKNQGVNTDYCPNFNLSYCYSEGVRYMNDGKGNKLYYNLFRSSNMIQSTVIPGSVWFTGNSYIQGTGSGGIQTINFYAGLSGNQWATPGNYTDTVMATISF